MRCGAIFYKRSQCSSLFFIEDPNAAIFIEDSNTIIVLQYESIHPFFFKITRFIRYEGSHLSLLFFIEDLIIFNSPIISISFTWALFSYFYQDSPNYYQKEALHPFQKGHNQKDFLQHYLIVLKIWSGTKRSQCSSLFL